MGTKASTGLGTQLAVGSPPTLVGECFDFKSGDKNETDDATNFDSSNRERIFTIKDGGKPAFMLNDVPTNAGQILLESAFASGEAIACIVTLPKAPGQVVIGNTISFPAVVEDFAYDIKPDKKRQRTLTLAVSGTVERVPGS